jgi:hypothetical protein
LVFQLREFLVEAKDGSEILFHSGVVSHISFWTKRITCSAWSFEIKYVSLTVPVVLVVPKIIGVAGEDKLA